MFSEDDPPVNTRERFLRVLQWVALTSVFWILGLAYVIWWLRGFQIPHPR